MEGNGSGGLEYALPIPSQHLLSKVTLCSELECGAWRNTLEVPAVRSVAPESV